MSWEKVNLTEISTPKQWKTLSIDMLTDEGYSVYGANGKIGFYSNYTHPEPTLMITCRGATCGNVHISEPFSYINGNAMALDNLSKEFDKKFLYYYFLLKGFDRIISGSAQPQITREGLSKIWIPKAPFNEQQKIAAILDQADALRKKDQQLLAKYDELLESIFYDMFGDPVKNEKGWERDKLKNLCVQITDGTHFSPPNTSDGVPYITARHLKKDGVDFFSAPTYISLDDHREIYKRCTPAKGDVLYIKDGATTGIACVNNYDFEFSMLSSLALIKPDLQKLNNYYLVEWLNNSSVKDFYIRTYMAGAAIKRFTLQKINLFEMLIPPLDVQNRFAEIVKNIYMQKEMAKEQLVYSESLFQSLLQKAFKGQLI